MTQTAENGSEPGDTDLHYELDDEQYEALVAAVAGEKVMGLALWEESITDEEEGKPPPEARDLFDCDLYLENNLFLALYGTAVFPDPDSDPLRGWQRTGKILQSLINEGIWLDEIAATDEDELVLILSRDYKPQLYLNVSGWSVEEWETLPGEQ